MALPNIDRSREGWYLGLFSVQCLACLALLTWYEVTGNTTDSALGTVVAVGKGMGQLVIVVAAWTVTLLEGYSMLAERYLRRRYREGRAEGQVEGRAEGRVEGRAEGRVEGRVEGRAEGQAEGRVEGRVEGQVERDTEWSAWLSRLQEAQARGEPFDEPSPAGDEARNGPRNHN